MNRREILKLSLLAGGRPLQLSRHGAESADGRSFCASKPPYYKPLY